MSYKNEIDKLLCMLERLENHEVKILDITEFMSGKAHVLQPWDESE
ncbi:hypothetical protein QUF99_16700 [Bacillus sp. DX4.1]|nr:hypothetical protein [Bacillus sp. DX4.1]MDM5188897.1 hypothetical protein [Bacillus sp. DX4.1]